MKPKLLHPGPPPEDVQGPPEERQGTPVPPEPEDPNAIFRKGSPLDLHD